MNIVGCHGVHQGWHWRSHFEGREIGRSWRRFTGTASFPGIGLSYVAFEYRNVDPRYQYFTVRSFYSESSAISMDSGPRQCWASTESRAGTCLTFAGNQPKPPPTAAHRLPTTCTDPTPTCENSSLHNGRVVEGEVKRGVMPVPSRERRVIQRYRLE